MANKVRSRKPAGEASGRFLVRLPKSMHRDLRDEARREGMSLNTLCVAKLGRPLAGVK